jgi:hypothetical protein
MVDFTGTGLRIADCGLRIADYGFRIADCEPMQIVYFFGKKPQELPVATCMLCPLGNGYICLGYNAVYLR